MRFEYTSNMTTARKDVGAECRHHTRPSVWFPTVASVVNDQILIGSGPDCTLGLTIVRPGFSWGSADLGIEPPTLPLSLLCGWLLTIYGGVTITIFTATRTSPNYCSIGPYSASSSFSSPHHTERVESRPGVCVGCSRQLVCQPMSLVLITPSRDDFKTLLTDFDRPASQRFTIH